MKHKTLLAVLIAFVVLSLACGACGMMGEVTGETGGDEDSPAATRPPSDKPDEPPTRPPTGLWPFFMHVNKRVST
jgi:hypothetical protein